MLKTDSVIKKIILYLCIAIVVLGLLHLLEILVVGVIWFIVLVSLVFVLLPTYLWTTYKKKRRKDGR